MQIPAKLCDCLGKEEEAETSLQYKEARMISDTLSPPST